MSGSAAATRSSTTCAPASMRARRGGHGGEWRSRLDRRILITGARQGHRARHASGASWPRAQVSSRSTGMRRRSRALAQTLAEGRIHVATADVADRPPSPRPSPRRANVLGGLDGVVNAAGIDLIADIEAMTLAEWSPRACRQPVRAGAGDAGRLSASRGRPAAARSSMSPRALGSRR